MVVGSLSLVKEENAWTWLQASAARTCQQGRGCRASAVGSWQQVFIKNRAGEQVVASKDMDLVGGREAKQVGPLYRCLPRLSHNAIHALRLVTVY